MNFSGREIHEKHRSIEDEKTETVFLDLIHQGAVSGRTEVSGEVSGSVKWGGKEGTKTEVSASGTVNDKKSNTHTTVKGTVNSDGEKEVKASAGKDPKESSGKDKKQSK